MLFTARNFFRNSSSDGCGSTNDTCGLNSSRLSYLYGREYLRASAANVDNRQQPSRWTCSSTWGREGERGREGGGGGGEGEREERGSLGDN